MKKQGLFVLGITLILLLIGIASANVFVVGKTFDTSVNESNIASDVYVYAYCSLNETITTKYTISNSDGSYGIGFDSNECNLSSNLEIYAKKGTRYLDRFTSTASRITNGDNIVIIENLVLTLTKPTSDGGGGGGGSSTTYYQCGNGVCDSGESASTCPQDCSTEVVELNAELDNLQSEEKINEEVPEETKGFFSQITGAVIGAINNPQSSIVIIFTIILASGVTVFYIRKLRKQKNSAQTK